MDFGWKKKAERLRMVLLSGGHQMAKELAPPLSKILDAYRVFSRNGDAACFEEIARISKDLTDADRPLWEPLESYGWKIQTTFYLLNDQLWWLLHAERRNYDKDPSDKDIAFLDKILEHLGADPKRDMIIGPRSGPADEPGLLPFGWWTWFNQSPLYEIQVNKDKRKDKEKIRIVPLGARESDGYQSLDALQKSEAAGDPT